MKLVLVGIDIILKEDLDVVVHLRINVLAQKTADNCDSLLIVSLTSPPHAKKKTHTKAQTRKRSNL